MSARGGYQEVEVEPGVWRILARSIGKDDAGYARNMAEYRAGELLKAQGFSHVQMLVQNGRWELGKQFGRGRRRVHSSEMEVIVRGAHDRSPPPECHEANTHSCYTQSAESMMAGARPKIEFPEVDRRIGAARGSQFYPLLAIARLKTGPSFSAQTLRTPLYANVRFPPVADISTREFLALR